MSQRMMMKKMVFPGKQRMDLPLVMCLWSSNMWTTISLDYWNAAMWYVSVCCINQISSVFGYVSSFERASYNCLPSYSNLYRKWYLTDVIYRLVCLRRQNVIWELNSQCYLSKHTLSLSSPMLPATDRDAHPILHETATRRGELPPHKQNSPQGHQRYLLPLSHKKSNESCRFRILFTLWS